MRPHRLLGLLVSVCLAYVGPCFADVSQDDPRALRRTDIQILQEALTWTGAYVGLRDGTWGRMTSDAYRGWRNINGLPPSPLLTETDAFTLLRASFREQFAVDWTIAREPHTGAWIGYPARYVTPATDTSDGPGYKMLRFESKDDRIRLQTVFNRFDLAGNKDSIAAFGKRDDVVGITYRLDRDYRQVITVDRTGNRTTYARVDKGDDGWRGFIATIPKGDQHFLKIVMAMSAEFSATGRSVDGPLADATTIRPIALRAIRELGDEIARSAPPARSSGSAPETPRPSPHPSPRSDTAATEVREKIRDRPPTIAGSGSAFLLHSTSLLVTNHHVVEGCTRVTLRDGTDVFVVRTDRLRDLALLRAPSSLGTGLRFRRDQTIDLAEPVALFGYPLFGSVSTTLNITTGIVTSLKGIGDDPMTFQVNTAMQPGNSGGPVVDESGLVIGVAVARLSDRVVMRETGAVPQTMNYAIRGSIVEAFLLEAGVSLEKQPSKGHVDLREIALALQDVVVPVLCYR